MEHCGASDEPLSVYREFAPRPELRDHVRALVWFGPAHLADDPRPATRFFSIDDRAELTPSFADAQTSLLFPLALSFSSGAWRETSASDAIVMGAMTRATQPPGTARQAMVGAYLTARGSATLLGVPAAELTDRILPLGDIWKGAAIEPELASVDHVEALIARRIRDTERSDGALHIASLARHVHRSGGRLSVTRMAELAGLSRQHLTRLFLNHIGVAPKLYARLARFRASLRDLDDRTAVESWSGFAARLGYADQSHLIADLREFSGYTPRELTSGRHFHPFIGDESGAR